MQKCGILTISDAGTTSNVMDAARQYFDALLLALFTKSAVFDTNPTYTIEVTSYPEPTSSSATFKTLKNVADVAVPVPGDGESNVYQSILPYTGFRIKASTAVSGDQVWDLLKHVGVALAGL